MQDRVRLHLQYMGSLVLILSFGALGCTKKGEAPKAPLVFSDLGWDSAQVHNRIAAFIEMLGG